jgi:putative addiction module component (TIGR02574 family)
MNVIEIPQISAMSVAEKINFVESLWDSIAQQNKTIAVPASHVSELAARLARHQCSQDSFLSLEVLQQKIAKRT